MFKYNIEYLTCFGAMTINTKYFNCKAWTPFGVWKKFLKETKDEDHYSSREYRNSFLRVLKDTRLGWR
jgi:hypothetical protein